MFPLSCPTVRGHPVLTPRPWPAVGPLVGVTVDVTDPPGTGDYDEDGRARLERHALAPPQPLGLAVVVAAEPDRIPRKGVERTRRWVEEETGSLQVRGGDFPLGSERIATLVLPGGVERSDRLQQFMERAKQATEEAKQGRPDPVSVFDNDELDSLL